MKALFLVLILVTVAQARAAVSVAETSSTSPTSNFLVFTIERYGYVGGQPGGVTTNETFKVELSPAWYAQFKQLPDKTHMGTNMYCSTWDTFGGTFWDGLLFRTQFHINADRSVDVWTSVSGSEVVDGQKQFRPPEGSPSTSVTLPTFDLVNLSSSISFSNAKYSDVNVGLTVKRVPAGDVSLQKALAAEVKMAGGLPTTPSLVNGDPVPADVKFKMDCMFQDD